MEIQARIALSKVNRTYFSGETIHGQILALNPTGMAQRLTGRIFILFYGVASTNLLGRTVKNEQLAIVPTNRRNSTGKEIYLQAQIFLTPEDSGTVELVPGQNGFPFEFELPIHLPSTYVSGMGYVQYMAMTSFTVAGYRDMFAHNIDFRVVNYLDLNLNSIAGRNSYYSFEKLVCTEPKHNKTQTYGLINTIVKLPVQGFTPGERIQVSIQMTNMTGLPLENVVVDLAREVQYACPAGSTMDMEVLTSWRESRRTLGHQETSMLMCHLDVPPNTIPTSSSELNSLISVEYFVIINTKLESARQSVVAGKIPITIGTVPFRSLEYPSAEERNGSLHRRTSSRYRNGLARGRFLGLVELEGAVGGDVFAPSAPALESSVEDEDAEDEFPPSYSEAVTMPVPSS